MDKLEQIINKIITSAVLIGILGFGNCGFGNRQEIYEQKTPSKIGQTEKQNSTEKQNFLEQKINSPIKIASFNIQVFGKSKRKKEEIMQVLEKVVRDFDIVAIQELRDRTETTLPYFVDKINSIEGNRYGYVGSPRLGRTKSKERYAFIYNKKTVKFENISYVYNDSLDLFEREPFIAAFSSGNFDYILVNIHTKPEDATKEIQALVDVVKDADKHVPDDKDVIVLGDFNADGKYFSETTTTGFRESFYYWVIPDNANTTVGIIDNAYDRIVFREEFTSEDFAGKWEVFNFKDKYNLTQEETKRISDHFPVWALFYIDRDTD